MSRRAGLLADHSRAMICVALLDGRAWTAGELAHHVGVSAPTVSHHLSALVAGGLLTQVRQGRHRYVRLAGPEIAQLIEDLGMPGTSPVHPIGLRKVRVAQRLAAGRTCYDHLAGDLGVWIHDALCRRDLLSDTGLTDAGRAWFVELLGPECLRVQGSRPLIRPCLDWTRRVSHLGGALGAALCNHLFAQQWIVRPDDDRAVTLTVAGRVHLALLGIAEQPEKGTTDTARPARGSQSNDNIEHLPRADSQAE